MSLRLYAGGTIIPTRSVGVRFSLSHVGLLIPVGQVHSELGSSVQRMEPPYSLQDRPASAFLARSTSVTLRLYAGGTIIPTRSVGVRFSLSHLGLLIPVGRVHGELGSCVQRMEPPYS